MTTPYAHDAACNTIHTLGPEPCPPPRPDWSSADIERFRTLEALIAAAAALEAGGE